MFDDPNAGRQLTEQDLNALEVGSAILGTGGGGNPYIGKLRALQTLRRGLSMRLMPLSDLPVDAVVCAVGGIGAPLVSHERIKEGAEGLRCLRALERLLDLKVDAIACEEIGGQNSMEPLITASMAGLPVVDCDGMGRAFPEMQMTTYSIYGHNSTPSALCDPHGNIVIFEHAVSEIWHERMARACVVSQGGASTLVAAPMSGQFLKQYAIPDAYTRAIALGEAVLSASSSHGDPIRAVCDHENGCVVFTGKVRDVERTIAAGFVRGSVELSGFDRYAGDRANVLIQNENLVFSRNGAVEVVVPDLVVILDIDTGNAITTEMLRFGQRVAVLALPCHPLLRTEVALSVVGPQAFGFSEITYVPFDSESVQGYAI